MTPAHMTEILTLYRRSQLMSQVRYRDAGPDLLVRKLVHRMGYHAGLV
jgi:G:T-mismatch repair DNA endonuclease (very short patch repair protein)